MVSWVEGVKGAVSWVEWSLGLTEEAGWLAVDCLVVVGGEGCRDRDPGSKGLTVVTGKNYLKGPNSLGGIPLGWTAWWWKVGKAAGIETREVRD